MRWLLKPLMRWLPKPLDKGNDSFERLDWKQESECDTGAWYTGRVVNGGGQIVHPATL